jgi:hypothetical protein
LGNGTFIPPSSSAALGYLTDFSILHNIRSQCSFGVFHLIYHTFHTNVMKEFPKTMVFAVILITSSFRDDLDELLYSFYLCLTSIGDWPSTFSFNSSAWL